MNVFITIGSVAMATRQKQFISSLNLNLGKTVSGGWGCSCRLNEAATQRANNGPREARRNSENKCNPCFQSDY